MKIGAGWIPDFVEVAIDRDSEICRLALIEVEAIDTSARASCRKYLPEASSEILRAFLGYLDNAISQCRSTSDPRLHALEDLKGVLGGKTKIIVHTAGALRTSASVVEDYPLIDQPERPTPAPVGSAKSPSSVSFKGERRLTRSESEGVLRAVRFLHAVIVGRDHSGSTLKGWRNIRQKPLDHAVAKEPIRYSHLHKLLKAKTVHGLTVNCHKLAAELAALWSAAGSDPMTIERAAAMISAFAPVALTFTLHEPMQSVFQRAREIVRARAI